MLKYTNTFITPPKFDFSRDSIMSFITPTVREQVHRIYKTRIFLADNLSALATSTLTALQNPGITLVGDTAYVDPTKFDHSRGVSEILHTLNITASELDDALVLRKNRNVDIVEKMDPEISLRVSEKIASQNVLTKQQPAKSQDDFARKNTFFKCLKLVDHPVRQYPAGPSAAQVTGYVDSDGLGRLGIEGYFHDMLAGKSGITEERRDSLGRPIFDENAAQEVK
jgi:cell division protein FtsI/penicillin-binding protein 2